MAKSFKDGIYSLTQKLANRRNPHSTNRMSSQRVDWEELRAIYKTGVGSKIIRIKSGMALNDTLQFENEADKEFYEAHLQAHVKKACKFMLAFGRGLIVPHEPDADLEKPLGNIKDWSRVRYHTFSADMVYVGRVNLDLASPDYFKPEMFQVRSASVNPARAVDFTYVEPVEYDAAQYHFGGISEFELIRNELVSDQIVQRAVPGILERASTLFYKVEGFKDLLADHKEEELLAYLQALESTRSIYGAGVVDSADEIEVHSQQLSNLADSDMITLRRLAMVTGLPLSWLVGEAAKGLNSTGEGERQVLQQTIETLQSEYLLEPINRLMSLHGRGQVWFKENQGEDPLERVKYEKEALQNALIMYQLGEDYRKYLEEKDVITPEPWDKMFPSVDDDALPQPDADIDIASLLGNGDRSFSDEDDIKRDKDGKFAKTESSSGGEEKKQKYTEEDYSYDESDYQENTNAVYESSQIDPVHEVRDKEKLNKIKKSMQENGYQGEPVLMVNTGQNNQAITGSHRIAAAQSIDEEFPVPVYEVDEDVLDFESSSGDTILDVIGRDDKEVAEFLEEYGDTEAASIMKAEIEGNDEA